jgi:hypothetical protein
MSADVLTAEDRRQIDAHGSSIDDVKHQLELYRRPLSYTRLLRACTPGDGIRVLEAAECERLQRVYGEAVNDLRAVKFVPASGAASRMFKSALHWLNIGRRVSRAALRDAAAAGDRSAAELETLLAGLPDLALWAALSERMRADGLDPLAAAQAEDIRTVLAYLLTERGLNCAELPKALLPFHRYGDEIRTPIDEHLVEAAHYVGDGAGVCRLHFTVSQEHLDACRAVVDRAAALYGARFAVRYEVGFSIQAPATDSIAVDPAGAPFRRSDGGLLLRPAGHGALLANLASLQGDIAFLKNIDNVVPDRLKGPTYRWKRAIGGLLVELQRAVFAHLEALEKNGDGALARAVSFLERELGVALGAGTPANHDARRLAVVELLDRPLRVCGIVANTGEAGGGPFWVEKDGAASKQIVESAQVDPGSPEQRAMLRTSTHFSPVDLVCTLRDRKDRPYDLSKYVDEDAYLVVEKSHEGRALRSIERPGLWNGSMASWNTVFVEVPLETFAPVKTINDLLRPEHRER